MKVTIEITDDKPAVSVQQDTQQNLVASAAQDDAGMAAGQEPGAATPSAGADASSNAGKPSDETFAWMEGRQGAPGNGTLESNIQVIDLGGAPDLQ